MLASSACAFLMVDSSDSDNSHIDTGQTPAPPESRCVQLLLERFPHVREVSEQLLNDSEAFRELCEEYEACTEAIERLELSATSAGLLGGYLALRLRLEGELLRSVSAHYSTRVPR
jgi:hypothetical protein